MASARWYRAIASRSALAALGGSTGVTSCTRESTLAADASARSRTFATSTPTREPSLLSSQIQQGPGHLPRAAYAAFERKWAKRCPGVVMSLREGGDELLTFFTFPKGQWKTLRTTNTIERLHEEFRRRVKTQGSLPSEDAALTLLFGLVVSGQIKLRKIDGWRKIATVLSQHTAVAA